MTQWFCSFYWRDFSPAPYSEPQKQKILQTQGGTCGQPNCSSELLMENGQFIHIKQFVDFSKDEEGIGLVICKQCFDNIREREKLDWIELSE